MRWLWFGLIVSLWVEKEVKCGKLLMFKSIPMRLRMVVNTHLMKWFSMLKWLWTFASYDKMISVNYFIMSLEKKPPSSYDDDAYFTRLHRIHRGIYIYFFLSEWYYCRIIVLSDLFAQCYMYKMSFIVVLCRFYL